MTTPDLQQGLQLHRAGRIDDAAAIYRGILRIDPSHADAWHLAGLCAVQQGEPRAGLDALKRAVTLNEKSAVYHTSLGTALQGCDEFETARQHFERAIVLNPGSVEAQFNLANLHRTAGRSEDSAIHYRLALQLRPDHPDILNNFATALKELGQIDEAEQLLRRALRANSRHVDAAVNLGRLLVERGATQEAAGVVRQTLAVCRESLDARIRLAVCLHELGLFDEAADALTETVRSHPDSAEAWTSLGNVYKDGRRDDDAIACYRRALDVEPDFVAAWNNLGNVLKSQQKLDEAATHYERALATQPNFEPAISNLAAVRQSQGRTPEARQHWTRANALRADPVREFQLATLLPPVYRSKSHLLECRENLLAGIDRLKRDGVTIDSGKRIVPTLFYTAYQGFDDRAFMQSASEVFRSSFDYRRHWRPRDGDRIRVGFLSAFLGDHTIGQLTRGLIRHLSRQRFHITILSPSISRKSFEGITYQCDDFVELGPQLNVALQRAAAAGLDVLVFPDIGMDPLTSTMARTRLARVQCVTWGHPVTTGMPTIDAFLSSRLLEPDDGGAHYSERLVQLDALPCCYERPALPGVAGGRAEFGLPDDRPVYLCPQSVFKLHPDFDDVLADLLDRDRRGIIALIDPQFAHWKTLLLERWSETLKGDLDRVQFLGRMSREKFLRLMQTADVMLDPLHFGGGNTNYEALALGLPVVTLPSPFLRGRVALGLYRRMGMEGCIADSHANYVEIAMRIANAADVGESHRRQIRERCHVLYDDRAAVGEIEQYLASATLKARSRPSTRDR